MTGAKPVTGPATDAVEGFACEVSSGINLFEQFFSESDKKLNDLVQTSAKFHTEGRMVHTAMPCQHPAPRALRRLAQALPLMLCLGLPWGFAPLAQASEVPLPVQLVTAHTTPVTLQFELSGTVIAAEELSLGFRSGGRIMKMDAVVGQSVRKGATLAELDPTQPAAAERAAQAQYAAASALLAQATQARERAAELAQRGAGTQATLDAAIEVELSAQSSRDQAQAQLAKARQGVADTRLSSPADGIVTARSAEPGQVVGAAQTVLSLAQDGPREAVFYVPDVPDLNRFLGQSVELRPVEGSTARFAARISEIAPLVAGQSGTVRVKARLEDGLDPAPGLGTTVVSRLEMPLGHAMELPWTALITEGGEPAVWVVDAQSRRVSLAPVRIARYTDTGVEVAQGLAEGAQVVALGAHLLYPGREVVAAGAQE